LWDSPSNNTTRKSWTPDSLYREGELIDMKSFAKTIVQFIEEMIDIGCCGADVPQHLDWEGKSAQEALEEACKNLFNSSAEDCCYSAKLELDGSYLSIADKDE